MADTYRIRFVVDPDAQFEECNGESRPLTEEEYTDGYQFMRDGAPVSYADYLAYYGNPERHVYIGAELERRCNCCDTWIDVDSLWRIDVMDDQPEAQILTHTTTINGFAGTPCSQYYMLPSELEVIPGYLREVTADLLPDDSEMVTRNDADLVTAICDIIARRAEYRTRAAAFDAIRELMTKRCEPVSGPDPRD